MARTREYPHFCPVARALEVIGEKWSLLVVRDLLRGPARFTDLQRSLGGITPKWLTQRLRELEASGLVERDSEPGRREVWYRLTARGRDLAPVISALAVWGIDHALRPPEPGEPIHPAQLMGPLVLHLSHRGVRLPRPVTWLVQFPAGRAYALAFDGARWAVRRLPRDEPAEAVAADVSLSTTPEAWAAWLTATPAERRRQPLYHQLVGPPDRVEEFVATAGFVHPPAVGTG